MSWLAINNLSKSIPYLWYFIANQSARTFAATTLIIKTIIIMFTSHFVIGLSKVTILSVWNVQIQTSISGLTFLWNALFEKKLLSLVFHIPVCIVFVTETSLGVGNLIGLFIVNILSAETGFRVWKLFKLCKKYVRWQTLCLLKIVNVLVNVYK